MISLIRKEMMKRDSINERLRIAEEAKLKGGNEKNSK
jgi:hypothetical protein